MSLYKRKFEIPAVYSSYMRKVDFLILLEKTQKLINQNNDGFIECKCITKNGIQLINKYIINTFFEKIQ